MGCSVAPPNPIRTSLLIVTNVGQNNSPYAAVKEALILYLTVIQCCFYDLDLEDSTITWSSVIELFGTLEAREVFQVRTAFLYCCPESKGCATGTSFRLQWHVD